MSGAFKWASVTFDPTAVTYDVTTGLLVIAAVAAARASASAAEATCRLEAEETVLTEALATSKREGRSATIAIRQTVAARATEITAVDLQRANARLNEVEAAVEAARTHTELRDATLTAERIQTELNLAVKRKQIDDARRGNTGIAPWRAQFEALRTQASELSNATEAACDLEGAAAVKSLLAGAGGTLQTTNEKMIAAKVTELESAVQKHGEAIQAERERAVRMSAVGDQAVAESNALIAGLQADEVVMRWHAHAVEELNTDLAVVSDIARDGGAERAAQTVREARAHSIEIVREANSAQLKADQRDYIAASIAKTLEEMGFVVGPPQAEHPEHPATATVIHAATASGKNIAVSVPVDGQVWYNVQGFPKSTEAAVGGGEAAVCDEAEAVITEMHEALMSEFHVQMGELMWDGKDTERRLRAVKSLPSERGSDRSMTGGKR
jgi:hypothetical protein